MRKGFIYIAFLILLFASCEEYYKPALDEMPKILVVESHVTNDPQQNFVRISKTRNYYSTNAIDWVGGAIVELVEANFQIIKAREDGPGYYTFPATPVPGKKYKLRITYLKDIFESDYVVMPPVPKIDSIYTQHKVDKVYRINGYGVPELFDKPGRQIYIDASVSPQLQYYRFSCRAIIQWKTTPIGYFDSTLNYTPEDTLKRATIDDEPITDPHDNWTHVLYGWKALPDNGLYNLAGPKEFSTVQNVAKHPIILLGYNSREYLDSLLVVPKNWIIILDQYGISKESYDFHDKLNKQFSADGSLFDPVLTQVYGNILCKTDPEKIALGYFDLNSYIQYRYYLNIGTGSDITVVLRRLNRYFDISDYGYNKDVPPEFWETD